VSEPRGQIRVKPDGITNLGRRYDQHVARYDAYLKQLASMRSRYAQAWGDDDIGKQFQKQFDQSMDDVEGIINHVRASLEYAAVGLRVSGEGYEEANEEAVKGSRMIESAFAEIPAQGAFASRRLTDQEPLQQGYAVTSEAPLLRQEAAGTEPKLKLKTAMVRERMPLAPMYDENGNRLYAGVVQENEPLFLASRVEAGEYYGEEGIPNSDGQFPAHRREALLAEPGIVTDADDQGERRFYKSARPGEAEPLLEPQHYSQLQDSQLREPSYAFQEATLATPAISSYRTYPAGSLVDGEPLTHGFELHSFSTFPDGTARADLNFYDTIVPVGNGHTVTGPDGTPVNSGGDQLFLVKPRPGVDASTPGYQPMLVSYNPDGSAVPLLTGRL
jgi:uncharacterized protein YukE